MVRRRGRLNLPPTPNQQPFPDDGEMSGAIRKLDNALGYVEHGVLFAVLAIIVLVAATAGLSDKIAGHALGRWSFTIIRNGTFVVAMCGAVFASHQQRHLAIDLVSRQLSPRGRILIGIVLKLFTIGSALLLFRSGLHIRAVIVGTSDDFISAQTVATALPVGAALVIFHTGLHLLIDIDHLARGKLPRGRVRTSGTRLGTIIGLSIVLLVLAGIFYVAGPWFMLLELLFISGAPLFTIVLGATAIYAWSGVTRPFDANFDGAVLKIIDVGLGDKSEMMSAVLLFVCAGCLLAASGTADRLVRFANAMVGWIPGGLAIVAIGMCALFTVFTGASVITLIALGGVLIPEVVRNAYPARLLIAGTGSAGVLFLPLLVYGYAALGLNFDLETAKVVGVVFGIAVTVTVVMAKKLPRQRFDFKELVASFAVALPELGIPAGVIGGLAIGFGLPEIAALTVVYTIVLDVGASRWISGWDKSPDPGTAVTVSREALALIGALLVVTLAFFALIDVLVTAEVLNRAHEWMRGFLLALNVLLLIAGTVIVMRKSSS